MLGSKTLNCLIAVGINLLLCAQAMPVGEMEKRVEMPVSCYCYRPAYIADGRWIFTGAVDENYSKHVMMITDDMGKNWIVTENAPVGDVSISPHDRNLMLAHMSSRDAFVSEDGGRTWRELFKGFIEDKGQVMQAFWSLETPREILLQFPYGSIFARTVGSETLHVVSKTESRFSKYKSVAGKHYGRMGPWDAPYRCVVSEDDCRSWQEIPAQKTPWSMEAKVKEKTDMILPIVEREKGLTPLEKDNLRCAVLWTHSFGLKDAVFCSIKNIKGPTGYSRGGVFISTDGGSNWERAALERTEGSASLFVGSPFVSVDKVDRRWLDIDHVYFDELSGMIFASKKGVCYATNIALPDWYPINELPDGWSK